jgi:uracil phosphoribosyltransferase
LNLLLGIFFMLTILTDTPSAANQFIFEMRHKDIQLHRGRFRNNMKRLAMAMALRISADLEFSRTEVQTPLGIKSMDILHSSPVLVTILRAGGPFLDGFLHIFDDADVGFIGAFRLESENEMQGVEMEYKALPPVQDRVVILLDPMLATGHSMINAAHEILKSGKPSKIIFAAAVASPEGIDHIKTETKIPFEIWTGDLDSNLDPSAYIVPGLGDAGDLSYGPKI